METFRRETVYKDFLIIHQRDKPNNKKCYYTVINNKFKLENKKQNKPHFHAKSYEQCIKIIEVYYMYKEGKIIDKKYNNCMIAKALRLDNINLYKIVEL
jgi:hypothetical protein